MKIAKQLDSASVIQITERQNRSPPNSSLYAARIMIPHHTTATAMTMQATVRPFKADEAIIMLSFAYPKETLDDSKGGEQRVRGVIHRLGMPATVTEPMRSRQIFFASVNDLSAGIYGR